MLSPRSSSWSRKLEALCCQLGPSAWGPSDQWVLYTLSPDLGYPLNPELYEENVSLTESPERKQCQTWQWGSEKKIVVPKVRLGRCWVNKIQLSPSRDVFTFQNWAVTAGLRNECSERRNPAFWSIIFYVTFFQLSQLTLHWGTCPLPACTSGWHEENIILYESPLLLPFML